jgi:Ala-tRNA(Pro) deacylase
MATRRIRDFLCGNKVAFGLINHRCAYTAQEVAQRSRIPGHAMAKSVIVVLDGRLTIVAVPATRLVDLGKLRLETGASDARLAEESEFKDEFEGCQMGTVPPFGVLFGMETLVDRELVQEEHVAFNAGTHTDVYVVRTSDFLRVVRPRIVDVAILTGNDAVGVKASRLPKARRHSLAQQVAGFSDDEMLQTECGCPVTYHQGAD